MFVFIKEEKKNKIIIDCHTIQQVLEVFCT